MIGWMAFSAVVATLAAAAALAAEHALRLLRLPTRGAWAGAVAASLILPLALLRPAAVDEGAPAPGAVPPSAAATQPILAGPDGQSVRGRVEAALPWAWGACTLAMAAGLVGASLRLARRRREWTEETVAGERVLLSSAVGPAVVGFIRPRIVMPRWALRWDEPQQRLMLRHEREHVRAGDPLLLLAALLAVALMPWSPALWWQLRRLRLAVEVDCDARTLRATGDVGAYGRLLLTVGRLGGAGAPMPLVAFSERRSFLERRISAMTLRTPPHPGRRALAWTFVAATAAVSLAALPAPAPVPLRPSAPTVAVQADTGRVWMLNEVDRLPRLANPADVARQIERGYPPLLRDAGIEGTVTVELIVEPDGRPRHASVATATRDELRDAALAAVNTARFRPALKEGRAVRVKLALPVAFRLTRDAAAGGPSARATDVH